MRELGIELASEWFMDFYDQWGNGIEIVGYEGIQFSKTDGALRGMELDGLGMTDKAIQELADKRIGKV